MAAGLEEDQVGILKIGDGSGTSQGCLPVTPLHCGGNVSVGLVDLKCPRRDPGVASGEALQTLLRGGRVSRQGLQERDGLQLFVIELLLLSKRERGGTLA